MTETILIFSDTHLTQLPNKAKLAFLLRVIERADRVIINGDFWDGYVTTAEKFVTAAFWKPLFKILKAKKALYLYGNHDSEKVAKKSAHVFSETSQKMYELKIHNQLFHIEHGNRIAPETDEIRKIPRPLLIIGSFLDGLGTRLGGNYFLRFYKKWNDEMKEWQKHNLEADTYLICGHSHLAEFNSATHFVNSGSIRGGLGTYILIENGVPRLVTEYYS